MTIRVTCDGDGCGKPIDRDAGGWFGVDYTPPPRPVEPERVDLDDDGGWVSSTVEYTELIQLGADHEFHFHAVDCLVSWAMTRAFTPQPEDTTT